MSGKTVGVVLTRFRNMMAVKEQDKQGERYSATNVVVGAEDQWECERVKPGGSQCDPERERGIRVECGRLWVVLHHHKISIKGIRIVSKQPKVIGQYDQSSQDAKVLW